MDSNINKEAELSRLMDEKRVKAEAINRNFKGKVSYFYEPSTRKGRKEVTSPTGTKRTYLGKYKTRDAFDKAVEGIKRVK